MVEYHIRNTFTHPVKRKRSNASGQTPAVMSYDRFCRLYGDYAAAAG
jgi:hypothetical protein